MQFEVGDLIYRNTRFFIVDEVAPDGHFYLRGLYSGERTQWALEPDQFWHRLTMTFSGPIFPAGPKRWRWLAPKLRK